MRATTGEAGSDTQRLPGRLSRSYSGLRSLTRTQALALTAGLSAAIVLLILAAIALVGFLLGMILLVPPARVNVPGDIEATRVWARLGPLPENHEHFQASVQGSAFTRGFVLTFLADESDVHRWLVASPGIEDAEVVECFGDRPWEPELVIYRIRPGGGAAFAEVRVVGSSYGQRLVLIRTFWS